MSWKFCLTSLICFTSSSLLYSVNVTNSTQLQNAIITANAGGDGTINFLAGIDLTVLFLAPNLRPLNVATNFTPVAFPITVNGNGNQLFSGGIGTPHRGFFVRGGIITLNDIVFLNLASVGGNGGSVGGGGGAGIGGALIVGTGSTVNATDCVFQNSIAQGGQGAAGGTTSGAGGGGGLVGNGGTGGNPNFGGGGGGGLDHGGGNIGVVAANTFSGAGGGGVGFNGTNAAGDTTGNGGNDYSGIGGGTGGAVAPDPGNPGGPGGGGGGGHDNEDGIPIPGGIGGAGGIGGGGGGGGAGGLNSGGGGIGGEFGGGGGGTSEDGPGGAGGFCGGGGGGGCVFFGVANGGLGGAGGFGGGGGGGGGASDPFVAGTGGVSLFAGGSGGAGAISTPAPGDGGVTAADGGGGGGAGLGGAIFIQTGGTLNILNSVTFAGNTASFGLGGAGAGATAGTNGTAHGADIFMMSGSFLSFDLTTNATVPNPIESDQGAGGGSTATGGLTKLGCARLTLNGANTYTGTTNLVEGELRIDGSVITPINVAEDALLSGNFTVTGNVVNNGTLAPGDMGIGQVTIIGNLTNGPNSFTQIDITPMVGVTDFITVTGTASLAGTLDVVVNAGNYIKGTQYTVINGTTNGTFSQVIETGVNAGLIDIEVSYSSVILTVIANRIFQNHSIDRGIPSEVAKCIINADIDPRSDFALVVQELGLLNNSELNRALINLSPVNYGALDWINARNNFYLASLLSRRFFQLCCSPRDCSSYDCNTSCCGCCSSSGYYTNCDCNTSCCGCSSSCNCNSSIWVDFFGNLMNNHKRYNNLAPFTANAAGVATGIDYCFCENWIIGAAFAYTHTWLDWSRHHGDGDINSYYGALYGGFQGCGLTIDVSAIGGASDHDLKRSIKIQGSGAVQTILPNLCGGADTLTQISIPVDINRHAKSDSWGYFFTGHLGISVDWECCCTTIEPFALVDYNYFHRNSFKEHGAESLNLKVQDHHQNMIRGEAGWRVFHTYVCECSCWAPYVGVSWVGEFPLETSHQKASFAGQSCVIDVNSYHSSVQLISPEVGFKWTQNCGFSIFVWYKGLFNNSTSINEVDVGFDWVF